MGGGLPAHAQGWGMRVPVPTEWLRRLAPAATPAPSLGSQPPTLLSQHPGRSCRQPALARPARRASTSAVPQPAGQDLSALCWLSTA